MRFRKHHKEGRTRVAEHVVDAVGRLIVIPARLVPLPFDAHPPIKNEKLFAAGMHMAGKHGTGFELEKDGSAAGLRVEPKKPPMDARPFTLLPAYGIAVDGDLAGHDFPLDIEP